MPTLSGTVFTPQRLLLLFCCINMIVYIDRGDWPCSQRELAVLARAARAAAPVPDSLSPNSIAQQPEPSGPGAGPCAGVISSNGVNGAANEPDRPGTGIQVWICMLA